MRLHSTLLAVLGSLALTAGCLGELNELPDQQGPALPDTQPTNPGTPAGPDAGPIGPVGGGGQTPQGLFNATVADPVTLACGSAGCHGGGQAPNFVAPPATMAAEGYSVIKAQRDILFPGYAPATAKLLTYGQNGAHKGTTYTPDGVAAITAWLAAEAADVAAGGGDQPSPLAIWSGCMNLADWQATGVADAWADKNANGQGDCDACHNLAGDNFIASNNDERVFNSITTDSGLMLSYFTTDPTGLAVMINRPRLQMVGQQQGVHQMHGAFNLDQNPTQRLQEFYTLTQARVAAGTCDPPRFVK